MVDALADITSAVSAIVTIATTGDLAIYFWGGVAIMAAGIMSRLKHA